MAMTRNNAVLIILDSLTGRPLSPPNSSFVIGRSAIQNPTQEQQAFISRRHALVEYKEEEGVLEIRDANTLNGTFVNGLRVGEKGAVLCAGDIVRIGYGLAQSEQMGMEWRSRFPAWSWKLTVAPLGEAGENGEEGYPFLLNSETPTPSLLSSSSSSTSSSSSSSSSSSTTTATTSDCGEEPSEDLSRPCSSQNGAGPVLSADDTVSAPLLVPRVLLHDPKALAVLLVRFKLFAHPVGALRQAAATKCPRGPARKRKDGSSGEEERNKGVAAASHPGGSPSAGGRTSKSLRTATLFASSSSSSASFTPSHDDAMASSCQASRSGSSSGDGSSSNTSNSKGSSSNGGGGGGSGQSLGLGLPATLCAEGTILAIAMGWIEPPTQTSSCPLPALPSRALVSVVDEARAFVQNVLGGDNDEDADNDGTDVNDGTDESDDGVVVSPISVTATAVNAPSSTTATALTATRGGSGMRWWQQLPWSWSLRSQDTTLEHHHRRPLPPPPLSSCQVATVDNQSAELEHSSSSSHISSDGGIWWQPLRYLKRLLPSSLLPYSLPAPAAATFAASGMSWGWWVNRQQNDNAAAAIIAPSASFPTTTNSSAALDSTNRDDLSPTSSSSSSSSSSSPSPPNESTRSWMSSIAIPFPVTYAYTAAPPPTRTSTTPSFKPPPPPTSAAAASPSATPTSVASTTAEPQRGEHHLLCTDLSRLAVFLDLRLAPSKKKKKKRQQKRERKLSRGGSGVGVAAAAAAAAVGGAGGGGDRATFPSSSSPASSVVSSGAKFGAHFVVYAGSPLAQHSHSSVLVLKGIRALLPAPPPSNPSPFPTSTPATGGALPAAARTTPSCPVLDQVSFSRLQQGVKKQALLAWVDVDHHTSDGKEEEEEEEEVEEDEGGQENGELSRDNGAKKRQRKATASSSPSLASPLASSSFDSRLHQALLAMSPPSSPSSTVSSSSSPSVPTSLSVSPSSSSSSTSTSSSSTSSTLSSFYEDMCVVAVARALRLQVCYRKVESHRSLMPDTKAYQDLLRLSLAEEAAAAAAPATQPCGGDGRRREQRTEVLPNSSKDDFDDGEDDGDEDDVDGSDEGSAEMKEKGKRKGVALSGKKEKKKRTVADTELFVSEEKKTKKEKIRGVLNGLKYRHAEGGAGDDYEAVIRDAALRRPPVLHPAHVLRFADYNSPRAIS